MKMRKLLALLLAGAMSMALVACGTTSEEIDTPEKSAPTVATSAAITVPATSIMKAGTLTIGCEIGYPPFEYMDSDGKTPIGFDIDLGQALSKKLGLKVELVDTAWDGIFAGLEVKKYDCIISAVTINAERQEKYLFSDAYIQNYQCMIIKKGSGVTATSPEKADGITIALQAETTSDEYMKKLEKDGVKFTRKGYDKILECFTDLELGRVDAVVCDSTVAASYLTKKADVFEQVWTQKGDAKVEPEEFGVCIRKGNTDLQTAVNKALAELKADGTIQQLLDTWFA